MNPYGRWTILIVLLSAMPLRADAEPTGPEPLSLSVPSTQVREGGTRGKDGVRIASLWGTQPATPPPRQTPLPAVVRVIAVDRNSMSLGSGSLVDANEQYGLIITNWHVVRDAVGPIEVLFPDGFHSLAQVVRTDREWDLAALLIWKPNVQPIPISQTAPRPGDPLSIAGYGSGNYLMQSGACTEYLSPAPGRPLEIVELSAAARHGDSGGPILNSRGEIAGVLFGEGGGRTDGSYCGRVQKFLQLASADLQRLPATNIAANKQAPAWKPLMPSNSGATNPSAYAMARFDGGIGATGDAAAPAAIGSSPISGWTEAAAPRVADRAPACGNTLPHDQTIRPLAMAPPNDSASPLGKLALRNGGWSGWGSELKSLLAAFGVAAILLQLLHVATAGK